MSKVVRETVSLPLRVARYVQQLARSRGTSKSQVIRDLIEEGIDAKEREKERFLSLADALTSSQDATEIKRLKEELARMTFGD